MSQLHEPQTVEIAEALEGRSAVSQPLDPFDGRCHRCHQKNVKRRLLGVEPEPGELLHDGERVRVKATWAPPSVTGFDRGYWRIGEVLHAKHNVRQLADHAVRGLDQVRGRANLTVEVDPHGFENVQIEARSRPQDGMQCPPVDAARQQYAVDHPDREVAVPADEPMPNWPEKTREWFDDLLAEHGPADLPDEAAGGVPL